MKVLMTADPLGGVWTYALALAAGLQRHDVEIVLAVMAGPLSAGQRADAAALRNVRLAEAQFRLEWMEEPWQDVAAAAAWLLRLEHAERPDIIHLNGYVHAALPWSRPVIVVAHSCVLSWWRAVHGCDAPSEWQRYRTAVTAGVQAATTVVAPTEAMLRSVEEHYGAVHDGCVIPNGCDPGALPLGTRDAFGRYARARALPEPFILAAGRVWDESKNLRILEDVAPAVRWPVMVAGSQEHPAGGSVQLQHVQLLGQLPPRALRQWQQRASIFVHPSVYEPFGLAPLECALVDTALVLADIPSLREVWQDAAVFVPPRDARAIAAALGEIAGQPLVRAERAAAARERAGELSARRMARAYHALYRRLRRSDTTGRAEALACAS